MTLKKLVMLRNATPKHATFCTGTAVHTHPMTNRYGAGGQGVGEGPGELFDVHRAHPVSEAFDIPHEWHV